MKIIKFAMPILMAGLLMACNAPEQESSVDTSVPPAELTAVYFKDASWWSEGGARTGVYMWDGDNKNADWPGEALESLGGGIWKLALNDSMTFTHLIFSRIGPEDLSDWGAKTVDLNFADINPETPMYDISGSSTVWGDPGVSGNWVAYNA